MIDGIGKTGPGRLELVRGNVERLDPAAKAGDAVSQRGLAGTASPAGDMAASGPPVDAGKVAAIRAAIAEGRYPVDPDKIAQAMLDLDLPKGEA